MKKKNKVIIGLLSGIGVGSLIVGPALGFAQNKPTDAPNKTEKSSTKQTTSSNPSTLLTSQAVNSHTFNDNSYLQTLDQTGITNPDGGSWTRSSALAYFTSKLNNYISIFGCQQIIKLVVIQNLNYLFNLKIGNLSNNSDFNFNVVTFNYGISNFKNDDSLANFVFNLNVSVTYQITSKLDGGSFTFTNNYTYNNVKIIPTIQSQNQIAYSAIELANDDDNLVVSHGTYFTNMSISNNWSNKDFSNLSNLDWMPGSQESATLSTSNYTYALPDMATRASHLDNYFGT